MNIIHYVIGIPPYRHGGAVKYAIDLLKAQSSFDNVNVCLLIPGDTLTFFNKSKIKKRNDFDGIPCFSIENPVIEPLLYGIKNADYILKGERAFVKNSLEQFYGIVKPDLIHIHTLMGLSKQFVTFMKNKGVKMVMTSHDYFGFCPKVNMINESNDLCTHPNGRLCAQCNKYSPSLLFLKICNSDLFLKYKHLLPIKAANVKKSVPSQANSLNISNEEVKSYEKLFSHYMELFSLMDAIHFNSTITKTIYKQFLPLIPYNSEVIPITTNYIKDRRKKRTFNKPIIEFGFIGGLRLYKGFPLLKSALIGLSKKGKNNFVLNVWEDGLKGKDQDLDNIVYRGKYGKKDLDNVFGKIDLLIVPSVWKETFSLVTMEALSFGTPVLVSDNVGAKDLVIKVFESFVFKTKNDLLSILENILNNPTVLERYNNKIVECNDLNFSEHNHASQILNWYQKIIA